MASDDGVHQTHCCLRHGCKYGYDFDVITGNWTVKDCPVAKGRIKQDDPCELCVDPEEARQNIRDIQEEIAFVEGLYKN